MGVPPNLGIWFALYSVALVFAAASAALVARRRAEYRPVAWFFAWVAFCQVVRLALRLYVLGAGPPGGLPYSGALRAFFHVEQALFVSWSFALSALAIHTFTRRRTWLIGLAYLLVAAILVIGYPLGLRRQLLQSIYLGVAALGLAVSLGALALWRRRRPSNTPPDPPKIAALLLVAGEVGAIVGPYAAGMIDITWPVAQGLYFGIFTALALLQVLWIRRS